MRNFFDMLDTSGAHIFLLFLAEILLGIAVLLTKGEVFWVGCFTEVNGALLIYLRHRDDPSRTVSLIESKNEAEKLANALATIAAEREGGLPTISADMAKDALSMSGRNEEGKKTK